MRHKLSDPSMSFRSLRKLIGILAFFLPSSLIILSLITKTDIQPSISHYNFTNFREIFTGCLCGIGLFMICYKTKPDKGDDIKNKKYKVERILALVAGIAAILIAFFPTYPVDFNLKKDTYRIESSKDINRLITKIELLKDVQDAISKQKEFKKESSLDFAQYTFNTQYNKINELMHKGSALILFSILAIFAFYIFPNENIKHNHIKYKISGILIVLGLMYVIFGENISYYYLLIGEVIMLFAFGFSWLVKGLEEEEKEKEEKEEENLA